jgi:hypothetical protein
MSLKRLDCALPVIALALVLAGCADISPQAPLFTPAPWPSVNAKPAPPTFLPPVSRPRFSLVPPTEAAPPVKRDPPPLVALAPDPPALRFPPLVTPLTPPADATDCTGWWRICHAY